MGDKKIIIKNPRFWFHSSVDYGKIPERDSNGKYLFREQISRLGVFVEPYIDENTRIVILKPIKSGIERQIGYPFSLTYSLDVNEWEKRKIIDSIEIKVFKNVRKEDENEIFFTILQVKKDLFKTSTPYVADYISQDQIIPRSSKNMYFEKPMFLSSIKLDNLKYDLSRDDDLILLQHIEFNEVKTGIGNLPYTTHMKYM